VGSAKSTEHSQAEHREIIIGTSALSRIVLVCFVERVEDTLRIFSARRATKAEIKDYEKNARKQTHNESGRNIRRI
jgi:uncharacterized DUF497 family protein